MIGGMDIKMTDRVGEKIKSLRKELNMTQSELAGGEMTKSMLSQIENNVSNPSIRTLQYIADRLNKPIGYFLEEQPRTDMVAAPAAEGLRQEENDRIRHISEFIDADKLEEARSEVEKLMAEAAGPGVKPRADILFKLGRTLIKCSRREEGKRYMNLAVQAYADCNSYIEGAKAYIELAKAHYQEFDYRGCLDICEKAFALYYRNINADPLFEIELYYYKIIMLVAVGDMKNAAEAIGAAISLSAETSVYYKTGELYRLNAIVNFLNGNRAEYLKSLDKATRFAEFAEDKPCLARIHALKAIEALESGCAETALEEAERLKEYAGRDLYVYYLARGRAYYMQGRYELAYENITKVDFPDYETHKFDYLNMWSAKVYEGLILNKLGRLPEAVEAIKAGIDKMSRFDSSKFLVMAYKSLSEVYSDMQDFQNAFICLKKANELQEAIDRDGNIVF